MEDESAGKVEINSGGQVFFGLLSSTHGEQAQKKVSDCVVLSYLGWSMFIRTCVVACLCLCDCLCCFVVCVGFVACVRLCVSVFLSCRPVAVGYLVVAYPGL